MSRTLTKAEFTDPFSRSETLVKAWDLEFRLMYMRMITDLEAELSVDRITSMLELNQTREIVESVETHIQRLANNVPRAFYDAGVATEAHLSLNGVVSPFDITHSRAISSARTWSQLAANMIMQEQRAALRAAMSHEKPEQRVASVRSSLGLTSQDANAVVRYRTLLEKGDVRGLRSKLRDSRADRSLLRLLEGGALLTSDEIDRMTGRFRQRRLTKRSEQVARVLASTAVHTGVAEMYLQAMGNGSVADVTQTWRSVFVPRTRGHHAAMDGQVRRFGEAFVSGNGTYLRFPGDPDALLSETMNCLCGLDYTIMEAM